MDFFFFFTDTVHKKEPFISRLLSRMGMFNRENYYDNNQVIM
mgnify:FL=1